MQDVSNVEVCSKKIKDTSSITYKNIYYITAKYKETASDSFPNPKISDNSHVIEKIQFSEKRKIANIL